MPFYALDVLFYKVLFKVYVLSIKKTTYHLNLFQLLLNYYFKIREPISRIKIAELLLKAYEKQKLPNDFYSKILSLYKIFGRQVFKCQETSSIVTRNLICGPLSAHRKKSRWPGFRGPKNWFRDIE